MEKAWLILDGRSIDDPDKASVYEAFNEEDGDTQENVIKTRDEDWPDGFVFEYDIGGGGDGIEDMINQKFIC